MMRPHTAVVVTNPGGTATITWAEFVEANRDGIEPDEFDAIAATLARGETYHGGGGATARWSVALKKEESTMIPMKMEVEDRTFEVTVNQTTHNFETEFDGEKFVSTSWTGLANDLKKVVRKSKVEHAIPVVLNIRAGHFTSASRYVRAVLRGQNRRSRAYLFTLAGGEKAQLDHPDILCHGTDIDAATIADLNAKQAALAEAQATLVTATKQFKRPQAWKLLQESEQAALAEERDKEKA